MKPSTTLKLTLLFIGISLTACTSQNNETIVAKTVTPKMIAEQEQLSFYKPDIKHTEVTIKTYLDTTSVEDAKKNSKEMYEYFRDENDEIIEKLEEKEDYKKNEIQSITKFYQPNEEKYDNWEDLPAKLVNNNHITYRDSVQKGFYFKQYFEDKRSTLRTVTRDNGSLIYEHDSPDLPFSLNFDSEKGLRIMNVYFHDGTQNNNPTAIESHAFPLNTIPVEHMKRVDSIKMELEVRYLTKIDTIHFTKQDIGVKKGDFKLLKVEDNYVEYELSSDYYPYHKGTVLEEHFYNSDGKVLELKFGISNNSIETPEEDYIERYNNSKETYQYIKNATTKEELFNAFKYLQLKFRNTDDRKRKMNNMALKGNVDAFTLYVENRRDTITFLTTLKNITSVKNVNVHQLEDKTEFIDKTGKVIHSIPSEIRFIYNRETGSYAENYFYLKTDDYMNKDYYFLDQENEIITKLPYAKIDYLCPSILYVMEDNKEGFQLLSMEANQLLSDKTFTRSFGNKYTKDVLVINDKGTFVMFNQDHELVSFKTEKVSSIILQKAEH